MRGKGKPVRGNGRRHRPQHVIESEEAEIPVDSAIVTKDESSEESDSNMGEEDSASDDEDVKQLSTKMKKTTVVENTLNPNFQSNRSMKASELNDLEVPAPQLSRREREEIEKERKKQAFWKAQMEGKTDQAKADMARLAVIRKQREEAARKRAEEEAAKAASKAAKGGSLAAQKSIISKSLQK
ncbi:heat- and acid-stable phosphoprotein [Nowakowskiella sp. JEL0407]|nr:heat- and acid-stable phosphoprotein [Nowakowskiella sp. JEL0407]